MLYTMELDVCVGSDEELLAKLGDADTGAGHVRVQPTGTQPAAEIVTIKVTGEVPAIMAWMINEWGDDDDEAIMAFTDAAGTGRLYMA